MPEFNQLQTVGSGGQALNSLPAAVRSRLLSDELLQKQAGDTSSPVYHMGAGIAKLGAGLAGGLMEGLEYRHAQQAQQANAAKVMQLAQALQQQQPGASGSNGQASSPSAPKPVSGSIPTPDPSGVGALIQQKAVARGIDPAIALKVAGSEGLNSYTGDNGSSYGPFQLHYGGVAAGGNSVAGLGDDFTKATGLDARDPKTVPQQIDFALDHAAKNGWGAFHGAAASKIGNWDGISDTPNQPAPNASPAASSSLPPGITPDQVSAPPSPQPAAPDPSLRDTITAAMQQSQGSPPAAAARTRPERP